MSISIGPGAHHGFAHGHSQTHGLGRQESPAWQARTADPTAKGSGFGALVSQIAQGKSAGPTTPDTSDAGATDSTPPMAGASDPGATATTTSSTPPPVVDPTTSTTVPTDPASDPAAPGSTVDIQV